MNDDWQINDLALCIKQGKWRDVATKEVVATGPRAGQILTVIGVGYTDVFKSGRRIQLGFEAWPRDFFVADNFIKISPHQSATDDQDVMTHEELITA